MNGQENDPSRSKELFKNFLNRQMQQESASDKKNSLENALERQEGLPMPAIHRQPVPSMNRPPVVNTVNRPQMPGINSPQMSNGMSPVNPHLAPIPQRLSPQNSPVQQNVYRVPGSQGQSIKNPAQNTIPSVSAIDKRQTESKRFVDFQAFQEEKEKAKSQQEILKSAVSGINFTGNTKKTRAEKYQDHRLGRGIPGSFEEETEIEDTSEEMEEKYANRRTSPVERPIYQDHRLGDALASPLPKTAGKGSRYQDHRLGPGIKS